MKHLFIARHGDYGFNDRLNRKGIEQIENLTEKIKNICEWKTIKVFSSSAPRAIDSSNIIISKLNIKEFEKLDYLWAGDDEPDNGYGSEYSSEKLMNKIAKQNDDLEAAIIVTHLEIAEEFPAYCLEKLFKIKDNIGEICRGQAVYLNLEEKTYQILP